MSEEEQQNLNDDLAAARSLWELSYMSLEEIWKTDKTGGEK